MQAAHDHEQSLALLMRQDYVITGSETELYITSDQRADIRSATARGCDVQVELFIGKKVLTLGDIDWRHGVRYDRNRHFDFPRRLRLRRLRKPAREENHNEDNRHAPFHR